MVRARRWFVLLLLVAAVAATVPGAPPARAAAPAQARPAARDLATVDPRERDRVLPGGWRSSGDLAWTVSGDAAGLHLLVAESRTGYTWRTVATLVEPGFDTDRWVGQACLTGSGRRAVVVYAPRAFTNRQRLFDRGAFAAVVDLADGRVVKLPPRVSLAYFNPGCGAGETAVLTQAGDIDLGRTRLHLVAAGTGKVTSVITSRGQVTSAVPAGDRIVAAAGARLVEVGRHGSLRRLAATSGVPFHLRAGAGGRVAFLDRDGATASVKQLDGPAVRTVASGPLGALRVAAGAGGRLFLTGSPQRIERLPQGLARLDVSAGSEPSTMGGVAVTRTAGSSNRPPAPGAPSPGEAEPVRIEAAVPATGRTLSFQVTPEARTAPARTAAGAAVAGSPTDPVDADRTCSVPRNDPRTQVYQPHWRQVEWAADLAVKGGLTIQRGPNWKQSGLPAWTPQGMLPSLPLAGGGRVPVQVMLGILAQESNLWQASNHAREGVTGNPLVGNFYGRQIYNDSQTDDWDINWAEADCGYGVAQVTDGMRLGDPSRTPAQQRAIALDYATNVAAGLRILQQKWNETYAAGLRIGNADPRWLESWYFAVWAYNTGFHPNQGGGAPWGVGWLNNPINPRYPADRAPFLELTYDDARTPQRWPYQEKVLGFAAYPIVKGGGQAGYRQAWWTAPEHRTTVKPPIDRFCDQSNQCVPGQRFPNDLDEPPGPCSRPDLKCWYHQAVTWKDCASGVRCGNENLRYNPGDPEPPDEKAVYPPNCSLAGLPTGALIVDDVATSVPSVRPDCPKPWSNAGSFSLRFGSDGHGHHPSKVDFHQIGGGFGAHFWFAHTRRCCTEQLGSTDGRLKVTGTWTLGQPVTGWARVLVHMPDHGAHTQQARYDVDLGNGTVKSRVLLQRTLAHRWVSLGAFRFSGTPRVSLSTTTDDGDGSEDVAWDAVAFQRLPGKPRNVVVALGDSYASGEGASAPGGADYYRETDNNGATPYRNACHRSRLAWARKATLADSASPMGARADAFDPTMDFHFLACSGAQTENLLPSPGRLLPGEPPVSNAFGEVGEGQYREVSQLDKGFLDEHTTLVTLSIGGNDARFGPVIQRCMLAPVCMTQVLEGDTKVLPEAQSELMRTKVKSSIVTVLGKLRDRAPNARVVLMGYPRLFERSGDCLEAFDQFVGLDVGEALWLNSVADELAGEMADAVVLARSKGVDAVFADPRGPFTGKAICGLPETIHGLVGPSAKTPGEDPSTPVSAQGFHPKPEGTSIYAAVLEAALRGLRL